MMTSDSVEVAPHVAPPSRRGGLRRLAWGLGLAVAVLAAADAFLLAPRHRGRDTTYDYQPMPGKWTFPNQPSRSTKAPIFAAFLERWDGAAIPPEQRRPDSWKARMTVLCELARMGDQAIPLLLEGLEDANPEIRNLSAQALGYVGTPAEADRLERVMTEDPDGAVRMYAGMSRAMIGGPIPAELKFKIAKYDPVFMTRSRLDLVDGRGDAPPPSDVRRTLAEFDLATMDSARVGEAAPDFTLVDQAGKPVRLADFRGKNDVVLVFIYGVTCMYCTGQVGRLHHQLGDFEAEGARVLVIESSEPYRIRATLETAGRPAADNDLPVLADPSHTVAARYGVAMQMDHVEWLNRPSAFVIDREGIIRFAHHGRSPADRPHPNDLLAEVRRLHQDQPSSPTRAASPPATAEAFPILPRDRAVGPVHEEAATP